MVNRYQKIILFLCVLAVLASVFFAGAWVSIKTARVGYDDGYFLVESFGQIWVYEDSTTGAEPEMLPCWWEESLDHTEVVK